MRAAICSLLVVGVMLWLDLPTAQCEAKHRLPHNVTDAFKIFQMAPVAIAMFDVDKDGDLDCLTTVRSNYDQEGHKVTYTWLLAGLNGHEKSVLGGVVNHLRRIPVYHGPYYVDKGHTKNVTFNLREGASPDKPVYTPEDGDGSEKVANFVYTDYKACTILEIPYKNEQECILWMIPEAVKDIPQNCVDYYEDDCDMKNPAYDEESCSPVMANL